MDDRGERVNEGGSSRCGVLKIHHPTDRRVLKPRTISAALYEQKWCVCMHEGVRVCKKREITMSVIVCVRCTFVDVQV